MRSPVTIITFHHVHPGRDRLTVPPQLLEAALRQICARHKVIAYEQFKTWVTEGSSISGRCVLLTFDDGYLDNYLYAFPVLRRLSLPAVIFPITNLVRESGRCRGDLPSDDHKTLLATANTDGFINTAELTAMRQSGLVAFASHSATHLYFCGQETARMEKEFDESAAFIRRLDGESEPYGFCWPGGKFDVAALSAIRRSAYRFAFSTIDGAWHRGDDPYTIRRIDVSSFSGDRKDYLRRLRKKLFIYGTPVLSRWYSGFKRLRIKAARSMATRISRR